MSQKLERNCPKCNRNITYKWPRSLIRATKLNSICLKCRPTRKGKSKYSHIILERKCPLCEKTLKYAEYVSFNSAARKKSNCRSCTGKSTYKPGKSIKGIKQGPNKKKGHPGEKNSMYGRSVYSVWVSKYGKEEADRKMIELKKRISINTSGKNNPMYGKSAPNGSGNGWKGWYKGWFFRSILELSYMINVIERLKIDWSPGEKIRISYTHFDGKERTYSPDFVLNNKYMIEIKPKKLINTKLVQLKKEHAIKYCKDNNLTYKLLCPNITKLDILKKLYDTKDIIFQKQSEEKFIKFCQTDK